MRPDEIVWDLRMIEWHPIQKEEGGGGERGGARKRGVGKRGGWVAVPPVALKNAVETVIGPGHIRH